MKNDIIYMLIFTVIAIIMFAIAALGIKIVIYWM